MPEKLAIVGAGSVGLVLATRLARAGVDTLLVTRSAAQARAIADSDLRYEDPASEAGFSVSVPTFGGVAAAGAALAGRIVVACNRCADSGELCEALARAVPGAVVAAAQNGVDEDSVFARRFDRVLGLVVRLTATRVGPARVRTTGRGRLLVGRHPEGTGPDAEALADALQTAGFDVGLTSRLAEDRWLKLGVNLLSAPNAMVRREDHATPEFVELKVRLLEEARSVLAAAGIRATSGDGRDRSLEEEIAHHRASLASGTSARRLPLYNQVWRALREGGPIEADAHHRTLLQLAAEHGVDAPQNARMLREIERAVREETGPERLVAAELL